MPSLHTRLIEITERVRKRSQESRKAYLADIAAMAADPDQDRRAISCSNIAHTAAGEDIDKADILVGAKPNIGIITSYNDMLSAHQPFEAFPKILRDTARRAGATAQVASGVPAMCDGITQGRPGMELSLMSRDVIAMATAVGLSHGVFDAALCLGVCDKIVPGLIIGALSFGHIPVIFIPAGPMSTGLPNEKKAAIRKAFARGEANREELLRAEASSYHGAGTCTFYGTANSNQMLMEIMGLHLPGAAFIHPHSDLRHALNITSVQRVVAINRKSDDCRPIGELLDERSFVNAIVGLHATGGSTNHTLHLPAMAAAAGIRLLWEDFADLSEIVPLLARIYPNGQADVNQFHAAGGIGFVIKELLGAGLLDGTARTVWGTGLKDYAQEPLLDKGALVWRDAPDLSVESDILRPYKDPHSVSGGLKILNGNLGKAVIKISAVAEAHQKIEAPAAIFTSETEVKQAYMAGKLNRDVVVVVIMQGPQSNGMPELHSLTPMLANLQDQGHRVALVTDGRMSGASGKVPVALHLCPEAFNGGAIGKIKEGDLVLLDAKNGLLIVKANLEKRDAVMTTQPLQRAFARPLFAGLRASANHAEAGGGINMLEKNR